MIEDTRGTDVAMGDDVCIYYIITYASYQLRNIPKDTSYTENRA